MRAIVFSKIKVYVSAVWRLREFRVQLIRCTWVGQIHVNILLLMIGTFRGRSRI